MIRKSKTKMVVLRREAQIYSPTLGAICTIKYEMMGQEAICIHTCLCISNTLMASPIQKLYPRKSTQGKKKKSRPERVFLLPNLKEGALFFLFLAAFSSDCNTLFYRHLSSEDQDKCNTYKLPSHTGTVFHPQYYKSSGCNCFYLKSLVPPLTKIPLTYSYSSVQRL